MPSTRPLALGVLVWLGLLAVPVVARADDVVLTPSNAPTTTTSNTTPGTSASSTAVVAPGLASPTAGAATGTGRTQTFTFTGALQGDAAARDRAYFRFELAPAAAVAADAAAAWAAPTIELLSQPGDATAHAFSAQVPADGDYAWRVCAWGVADGAGGGAAVGQLACSPTRAFTSTPLAAVQQQATGVVELEHTHLAAAPPTVTRTVVRTLPIPAATTTTPRTVTKVRDTAPTTVQVEAAPSATSAPALRVGSGSASGSSAGGATDDDTTSLTGVDTVGDRVSNALSFHVPGVPLPFWTLLLLASCLPLAVWWNRMMARMFVLGSDGPTPAP